LKSNNSNSISKSIKEINNWWSKLHFWQLWEASKDRDEKSMEIIWIIYKFKLKFEYGDSITTIIT
jgi:hypothetical protein